MLINKLIMEVVVDQVERFNEGGQEQGTGRQHHPKLEVQTNSLVPRVLPWLVVTCTFGPPISMAIQAIKSFLVSLSIN